MDKRGGHPSAGISSSSTQGRTNAWATPLNKPQSQSGVRPSSAAPTTIASSSVIKKPSNNPQMSFNPQPSGAIDSAYISSSEDDSESGGEGETRGRDVEKLESIIMADYPSSENMDDTGMFFSLMSTMWSFLITCKQLQIILLLSILRKLSACRNALLKHWKHAISRVGERVMCSSATWWGPTPTPLLPLSHPRPIYCDIRAMPIKYWASNNFPLTFLLQPLEHIRQIGKTIRNLSFMLIIRVTMYLMYRYSLEAYESICRVTFLCPTLLTQCITRYDPPCSHTWSFPLAYSPGDLLKLM